MTKSRAMLAVYPILGTAGIVALWQIYTMVLDVSILVLPSPLDIAGAIATDYPMLFKQTWPTLKEIIYGCGLALLIGIPIAVGIANSRLLSVTFYPILIAVQSVPKVAIAPILLEIIPDGALRVCIGNAVLADEIAEAFAVS